MSENRLIMTWDQGTTSSRCILFDRKGEARQVTAREFTQIYPHHGWVEHDPLEIWETQLAVANEALSSSGIASERIAALGISNQRETVVLWDKTTGLPVCNAIVWQCRRTSDYCDRLKEEGFDKTVLEKTGLLVDAYFSATKIKWVFDNIPEAKRLADEKKLLCGTIDTWLIWKLTCGRVHATDYTNASRTMLFNIHTLQWDEELLSKFSIPADILPEVRPSSCLFGYADEKFWGKPIPISGVAGDQQAALFGQHCRRSGDAKNTYGTGCFLLMNTGSKAVRSNHGLLTTIAATAGDEIQYALEGSIFVGGAVMQWLRDELSLIGSASESEELASSVKDNNGVYIVPAFVGLGTPYWNPHARGTIVGLDRGAKREHLVRAALESMAYQTLDVLSSMERDCGSPLLSLKVDGGASNNDFLMQFQSDILRKPVTRPWNTETTALGAAYLAGLSSGYWANMGEVEEMAGVGTIFEPSMDPDLCRRYTDGWHRAVDAALHWASA